MWVTAWNDGFLTPAQADETIRLAVEANLNALIIQVRKVGDAYYDSAYEPRGNNIAGGPEYDPLAYVIEKAHAAGLQVHAWMNVFRVWRGEEQSPDDSHVTRRNPEWLTRTRAGKTSGPDGQFLDPGVPEVKDYVVSLAADLLSKYDLDGLHLDYIRYPGRDFGYNPTSLARFNAYYGRTGRPRNDDPDWCEWRRDQVTQTVRRIYYAVQTAKPSVRLTAAVIPWGDCASVFEKTSPYRLVYQNWAAWLREGIVDACIPMNYKDQRNPEQARQYRNWLHGMARWRSNRQVYTGVMLGDDVDAAIEQIKLSRQAGLDGVVGFAFNATPWRDKLVQALRTEVFQSPARVPAMAWKSEPIEVASADGSAGG